ncbi:MAG: tRNA pseudouridine(38-40) synthase TruA [Verrucomicrobiales bacterium]|nr:tRNA pseudouridine(38-40) synthase TruA [Verrucomicrobiales bacterium]
MTAKYAMLLSYEGTDFCGWQIQRGTGIHENIKPSVEGIVTGAVQRLCGESVTLVSSGRTDAGVHASGQVAHFSLSSPRAEAHFADGLNDLLPPAIRVRKIQQVPDFFRAQRSKEKQYSYYFQQGTTPLPHLRTQTFWNRYPLAVEPMNEAIQALVGEHDFLGFCGAGAQVATTVRTIHEASVSREAIPPPGHYPPDAFHLVHLTLRGTGFLKQMVRNIAGTLRQIGEGRRPPGDVEKILKSLDRKNAGPTASPEGLWLDKVWYEVDEGTSWLNE